MSTMTWLIVTVSPGFTCQDTMSASVRPSPTSGSLNSLFNYLSCLAAGRPAVTVFCASRSATNQASLVI